MEYDVALSFAGEDREYVEAVASELKKQGVRVFYDNFETVNLWGKDLYTHLQDVYQNQAKYTVIFISEHYAKKLWTNHERKMAQARAFSESNEYILPARFDDTKIKGIVPTTGFIDLRRYTPKEFSDLICKKLKSSTQKSESTLSPFLLEARKLAEKKDYDKFRAEWRNSSQSVTDVTKSIDDMFQLIRKHFSPDNDFHKLGIHLNEEKYLRVIYNEDFGCQILISGGENIHTYLNHLPEMWLILTLFRRLRNSRTLQSTTKVIESLTLVPDVSMSKEIVWRDEANQKNAYSSEKVVEKLFEMLIEQIKKGKPLNETVEGGRYLVDGRYVDAWGNPIEDDEHTNNDDYPIGGARSMVQGNWICKNCGSPVNELPLEPKDPNSVLCRDCHLGNRPVRDPRRFGGNTY